MKCSFDISNFLEKICLTLSVVIFCFFALFIEEGILVSPYCFLEFAFSWSYLSLSPLVFASILSSAICQASLDNHFAFLFFFFFGMVLFAVSCTILQNCVHNSSRSSPLNLFVNSTVNAYGIWFKPYLNDLAFFLVFFSLSLNFAMRSWWSEPQVSSRSCFCFLYLWLQRT